MSGREHLATVVVDRGDGMIRIRLDSTGRECWATMHPRIVREGLEPRQRVIVRRRSDDGFRIVFSRLDGQIAMAPR